MATELNAAGANEYIDIEKMNKDDFKRTICQTFGEKSNADFQDLCIHCLGLLNQESGNSDIYQQLFKKIKDVTGMKAVGLRLKKGDDFPYFEVSGFQDSFLRAESSLCVMNGNGLPKRDANGNIILECLCGNVINGNISKDLPCYTAMGSFVTNSTTEFIKTYAGEHIGVKFRNRCNHEGYESMALIPLRSGNEIIGLLQLNDNRTGIFSPEAIAFLEGIGNVIGIALKRKESEENQRKLTKYLRELMAHMNYMREDERAKLASDLHDELSPSLIALNMDLEIIKKFLSTRFDTKTYESLMENFDSMTAMVKHLIRITRTLTTNLKPEILEELGFVEAIKTYLYEFNKKNSIDIHASFLPQKFQLEKNSNNELFSIFTDIMENVPLYTNATGASVFFKQYGQNISLLYKDNGLVSSLESLKAKNRYGILGLNEYIAVLNGLISFRFNPGEGTSLKIEYPLHK